MVAVVLAAPFATATEVDDISTYYYQLKDAEPVLNARVQQVFDEAQSEYFGCDLNFLGKKLGYKLVGNLIFGTIEDFANKTDLIEKTHLKSGESIYAGTPFENSWVDWLASVGVSMNIAGHRVGSDKLGHFVDMGYSLYWAWRSGQQTPGLVGRSRGEQQGIYGSVSTGVKSYADMAANWDGLRFWRDVFGRGDNPYFRCEGGRLRQVRAFRWADYVTPAWSEAINCSEYSGADYIRAITVNISKMEHETGRRYTCPIEPAKCAGLAQKYPAGVISLSCL